MATSPTSLRRCARCGQLVEPVASSEAAPAPHYAVLRCPTQSCNQHMGFAGKPDAAKAKRPASQRELVKKYGVDYCEICTLTQSELPPADTLEGHHINEFRDGGEATAENVLTVCTHCHLLIHFQRDHYAKTIRETRAESGK